MKGTDMKGHFWLSMVKSVWRIVGLLFLPANVAAAAGILIAAEIIGMIEEIV